MKKSFFSVLAIVLLLSTTSFAQMKFTVNAGLQSPTGNMKIDLKSGYGGNLTLDYSFPLLPITFAFTAGYNRWDYKDTTPFNSNSFYSVSLMAGIRFYSGGPYVGADVGYSLSNSNITGSTSSTEFTFSPIVGYRFSLTPIGLASLDLNIRYWSILSSGPSTNWIGLNAGVAFGL